MENNIAVLIGLMATLAFIGESTVEYLFGRIERVKPYLCYVALLVGVGLALAYQVDVLDAFFGKDASVPYVGEILTGCVIGRGASFLHDFATTYLKPAPTP